MKRVMIPAQGRHFRADFPRGAPAQSASYSIVLARDKEEMIFL
jgi:hypothetical protein